MARGQEDPIFAAVRERCRLKRHAAEDRFMGETVFRIGGRVFAMMGRPGRAAVTVRAAPLDAERQLRHPNVRRARYIGKRGWLTVSVTDEESLRLALDLIDESYYLAARHDPRPR